MRLEAPLKAINFFTRDIYGEEFNLSQFKGKKVLLSFFRDAGCPFCNYRVHELIEKQPEWQNKNLTIVTVFSDSDQEIKDYVADSPRPFTMLADQHLAIYNLYGVEQSSFALLKAFIFKLPTIIRGFMKGARTSKNPHSLLVPADFLIDEEGIIQEIWYGKNTASHMPMNMIEHFIQSA